MADYDVIVIGGGMIGIAIGYGLARLGQKAALFDEGDRAFRAARGNFGLVWVQGKGSDCPEYATWTQRSADLYPEFNAELKELTDTDIGYSRPGGIHFCLTEQELEDRKAIIDKMVAAGKGAFDCEMLSHNAVTKRLPGLGPTVAGGSYSPMDGHVNPLYLLRAMHAGFKAKGGSLHAETVVDLAWKNNAFEVTSAGQTHTAAQVVLAAGLGNRALGSKVGLIIPVRPQRGQILVTEKLEQFLEYPTIYVRQTAEGSVMLGDSHEDVGFDDGTSSNVMQTIARRAIQLFPLLKQARIVRTWGALRILTPDSLPVYDQSQECPGAFSASAHSGVTLSAVHALDLPQYIARGQLPPSLDALSERRFHVH